MSKVPIVDALTAFTLGLAVLEVANALVQGLVVEPIESQGSEIPQSASTLTIHVAGRPFTFLGIVEALVVLGVLVLFALTAHRRVRTRQA